MLRLATDNPSAIGRFLWQSFEGTDTDPGKSLGTVQLVENLAHIEFHPDRAIQVGLTWETLNTGDLAELLPTVGVDVVSGTLDFAIRGDQISGVIQASGQVFSIMPDSPLMSSYTAQFTGDRQSADKLPWPDEVEIMPSSDIPSLSAEIPLPAAVFDITVQGTTETQAFVPLTGTRTILPSMDFSDPNPFSVTLLTDVLYLQQNGCLCWTTFDAVDNRQILESRVFVDEGQVRLVVEPSERFKTLSWKTIMPDGQIQPVQAEQGTLTFQLDGNELHGEVHATGFTLGNRNTLSTYDAQIIGQKQGSPLAEKLRRLFNVSSLTETWSTDDGTFDRLKLQITNQQVKEAYSARSGGFLSGIMDGDRAEFIWHGQQRSGTGWIRSQGTRGLLVGRWQEQNGSQSRFFVGTRQYALMLELRTLTNQDVDDLWAIGQELWQQGRGELAIPLLEKVLEFYQVQRLEYPNSDHSNSLITVGNVLNLLIHCELQCKRYYFLPNRLREALDIQRLLDPRASFKSQFQRNIDEVLNTFKQALDQIEEMRSHLQQEAYSLQNSTELITAYSLLFKDLEKLKMQLSGDYQNLTELKHHILTTQQESNLTWIPLIDWLVSQRSTLQVAISQILERQKQYFSREPDLINYLEILLQGLDFQKIQGASLDAIATLDTVEIRLNNRLASHSQLADGEKRLFQQQYGLILSLILLGNTLMGTLNSIVRLEESNFLTQGTQIMQQSIIGLSEHLESWRGSLVKEVDKIEMLAQGQIFFQELLPLLIQLNSFEVALMIVEKAKTRAFADLLAIQPEIQSGIRQVFSTEKVLLSLVKAPSIDFQEVLELLQV